MNRFFISSSAVIAGLLALVMVPSCDNHKPDKPKAANKTSKVKRARSMDKPIAGLSKSIEEFTGSHTRIVWTEHPRRKSADTFANTNELVLKGIDTRDGKGERMIQDKLDNYARPLLTSDGEAILFTDKEVKTKNGRKHYDPDIYRTDWEGAKPVHLASGYAVDSWRDPATGVEWVYAARNFPSSKAMALEATELVRFPLDDPSKVEVVYNDSLISPDNIQFSRDGSRASGLFPWPHAGVMLRDENGIYHPKKLATGCWPSMAPDDSGVSWVFDGGHRGASFFAPEKKGSWTVKFNDGPVMKGFEMYHPRWTNHPRFLAITGPYIPVKNAAGNVINKGGTSAEVYLGRFSEKLDKVEAWLQISRDKISESYPDVWIEDADEVELAEFRRQGPDVAAAEVAQKAEWPAANDSLVFLWRDRNAVNQIKDAAGRLQSAPEVQGHGTGRYGRVEEMVLDGGYFEVDTAGDSALLEVLRSGHDATLDMILMPAQAEATEAVQPLFSGPKLAVSFDSRDHLLIGDGSKVWQSEVSLPRVPYQLSVVRKLGELSASANGEALKLTSASVSLPAATGEEVRFGGGWEGGILDVAIYQRALTATEMQKQSALQKERLAQLPPAPAQVKIKAKLVEASGMPTAEGIAPYTGALVACVYEVEQVVSGALDTKSVLVKHWAMLDQRAVENIPRELGKTYELTLEREADHPHLKGERVMDDTTAFDLEPWFDATPPRLLQP